MSKQSSQSRIQRKILIIVGGNKTKLIPFAEAAKKLAMDVTTASFSDLHYFSLEKEGDFIFKVAGVDAASFDLVYIRLVGKRLEDATLLANYARDKRLKIIDRLYEKSLLLPPSISKAMETKLFIEGDILVPPTLFGSLEMIVGQARQLLGFPFVVKTTSGKKARDVWSPKTEEELEELFVELRKKEKQGIRFFAQQFITASQRVRVLVVGGKALGAITRPTKWRKRFLPKIDGEYPEGRKEALVPVPKKYGDLAVKAARVVSLDIAGVDILEDDETGEIYVLEANAAPSWELIKKDTQLNVEEEILKFLAKV